MNARELSEKLLSVEWETPDATALVAIARALRAQGYPHLAATAYDRAYAEAPQREDIRRERAMVLDALALNEHGITWRYIPAGPFIMGSEQGDPDESPAHSVELGDFYLSDTPITWSRYGALMGRGSQPTVRSGEDKIRSRYCASLEASAANLREFDSLPMVAASRSDALALAERLTRDGSPCSLPTEAQWEKAARGGLVGATWAWGDAQPSPLLCDYERFGEFSILPPRSLPPNGYGLYGMSGGVWEWVIDGYDALFYESSPRRDPVCPPNAEQYALRGGSWADCASAVRVAFRMGVSVGGGRFLGQVMCPTVGFRLVRHSGPWLTRQAQ